METDGTKETTAIITGLGLVGIALFCALGLYSYESSDLMGFQSAAGGEMANLAGVLGARVAHHLRCLYGLGAWVIVAFLLLFGLSMLKTRSLQGMASRAFGALLFTAVVCAWGGTRDPDPLRGLGSDVSGSYPIGLGGLVGGQYLGQPMANYFGPVGVYLVLVTIGLLAGLLAAQQFTEICLALIGRGVVHLWTWSSALCGRVRSDAKAQLTGLVPVAAGTGALPTLPLQGREEGRAAASALKERAAREKARALEKEASERAAAELEATEEEVEEGEEAIEVTGEVPVLPGKGGEKAAGGGSAARSRGGETPERAEGEGGTDRKRAAPVVEDKEVLAAEESRKRRVEAVRQAEEAERNRLQKEKEARERMDREGKALEKIEQERLQREKLQGAHAKFMAAMVPKGKEGEEADEEGGDVVDVPRLPDNYRLPDLKLLDEKDLGQEVSSDVLTERGAKLIETLWEFKIGSRLVNIVHGPTVTMYELSLDAGIKVSKVVNLQDNLAMAMKAEFGVRIIAPLPGKDTIGIEIPNTEDYMVRVRPIIESTTYRGGKYTLPLILGRDATGNPLIADLVKMPHLLIAGTTGSGKSVCVNSIILSIMLLRRPHDVKLILVDPKQVEMTDFKGIPHLLAPVVTDMKLAAGVLTWAVEKMEERYERMGKVGVRNISSFNKMSREDRLARIPKSEAPEEYFDPMPYVVIVVDEFADLMMTSGKEIEQSIARLAQKARAAGVHVILATQRPSADVVTGLIKTNLPCRICFQVKSKIDSRIVLDTSGAEKLAGKGDMLFVPAGTAQLIRAKGVFVDDREIRDVVECCKGQASPIYSDEIERAAKSDGEGAEGAEQTPLDERFEDAVECFLALGRASTSLLQRRLGLGYTRAAKLCDQMEARGIVGPDRGAKGRELLINHDSWETYKHGRSADLTWGPKGSKDNPLALPGAEPAAGTQTGLDEEAEGEELVGVAQEAGGADAEGEDAAEE